MSEQDHSSFVKTPQQLVAVVLLAFLVPIFGILMIVQLVVHRPKADPAAMTPEAVAARIQPLGRVEFGEAGKAAAGPRTGEDIVKSVCGACHVPGAAGAPRIGDKAAWAPLIRKGLDRMLAVTIKGEKAMPPRGGAPDLTDLELARAIVFMANQSGGSLKEPAEAAARPAAKK